MKHLFLLLFVFIFLGAGSLILVENAKHLTTGLLVAVGGLYAAAALLGIPADAKAAVTFAAQYLPKRAP